MPVEAKPVSLITEIRNLKYETRNKFKARKGRNVQNGIMLLLLLLLLLVGGQRAVIRGRRPVNFVSNFVSNFVGNPKSDWLFSAVWSRLVGRLACLKGIPMGGGIAVYLHCDFDPELAIHSRSFVFIRG
jgi:hypothetical protein